MDSKVFKYSSFARPDGSSFVKMEFDCVSNSILVSTGICGEKPDRVVSFSPEDDLHADIMYCHICTILMRNSWL